MTPRDGAQISEVRALVAAESELTGDDPGVTGWMQRLCRAATRSLPAMGVGVSLMSDTGNHVSYAASSPACEQFEELQFTMGEGPCMDAFASRKPVLTSDLAEVAGRWPGYATAIQDHGVRAVYAFPLQIGAARLGALDIYRALVGGLSASELAMAFAFAEVAMGKLLDAQDGSTNSFQQEAAGNRFELYQAQGMVMVQLGVDLTEAMARLRAYAYAQDSRLADVADAVVEGKLIFKPDDP